MLLFKNLWKDCLSSATRIGRQHQTGRVPGLFGAQHLDLNAVRLLLHVVHFHRPWIDQRRSDAISLCMCVFVCVKSSQMPTHRETRARFVCIIYAYFVNYKKNTSRYLWKHSERQYRDEGWKNCTHGAATAAAANIHTSAHIYGSQARSGPRNISPTHTHTHIGYISRKCLCVCEMWWSDWPTEIEIYETKQKPRKKWINNWVRRYVEIF